MKRFLKIRFLFTAIVLLLSLAVLGAGKTFVIEQKSGVIHKVNLLDEPIITVPDSRLVINSKTFILSTPRKDVAQIYFASDGTSIEETHENVITYTQTNDNRILITNLPEKENIVVSDLAGHLYNSSVSRNDKETFIDLNGCPKGVYIIKIGNKQTIKIAKK